jgi:hypothetical protein
VRLCVIRTESVFRLEDGLDSAEGQVVEALLVGVDRADDLHKNIVSSSRGRQLKTIMAVRRLS